MAYVDIDITDYLDEILDEIDTDDLIEELKKRSDIPKKSEFLLETEGCSRTPIRDAIIQFLGIHPSASLEDIQEAISGIYYK